MISIARTHSRDVQHWQGGQMALRWCAAGIAEDGKQFRRVNGHMLLAARDARLMSTSPHKVSLPCVNMATLSPPDDHEGRYPKPTTSGIFSPGRNHPSQHRRPRRDRHGPDQDEDA